METAANDSTPLRVHSAPGAWGNPSISAATAKLLTWLKMAELEHELVPADFSRAPKGKIPFIEQGEEIIADSTLIIEHFAQTRGIDLDAKLGERERAIGLAFRRMLKENDYWALVYIRYVHPDNWPLYAKLVAMAVAPGQPEEAGLAAAEAMKEVVLGQAHGHGMGRHSGPEIEAICRADVDALSTLLGDGEWMLGAGPSNLDATLFGYFGNIICSPFNDELSTYCRSKTNLVELCGRIRARYFPELVEAVIP